MRSVAQKTLLGFLCIIVTGTALLTLPACSRQGRLSVVDALFTATSATCVTGLIVKDTGRDFTPLGQFIILALIQVGGLGIMTLSAAMLVTIGRRAPLEERVALTDDLTDMGGPDYERTIRHIFRFTFVAEALGALCLLPVMVLREGYVQGLWSSVFHSVSAFCNAGFSLYSDSLCSFRDNVWVNLVMSALIILGGIGFVVVWDLGRRRRGYRLSLHSRVALTTTAVLLVLGTTLIFLVERNVSCRDLGSGRALLAAFFQSVTTRTAGFNTLPMSAMSNATLSVMILLMFIGASPFSTGGGIKTTTLAVLVVMALSRFRGRDDTVCWGRRFTPRVIARCVTLVLSASAVVCLFFLALMLVEQGRVPHTQGRGLFLESLFETVSAFGTVGLSMGFTGKLSAAGKLLITLLMYVGRVGPLALIMGLSMNESSDPIRYPSEDVAVG